MLKPYLVGGRHLTLKVSHAGALSSRLAPQRREGKRFTLSAARLVCAAWHGLPYEAAMVVGFKDGDHMNLKSTNLQWVSWNRAHHG